MDSCLEYRALLAEYSALLSEYQARMKGVGLLHAWDKAEAITSAQKLLERLHVALQAAVAHKAMHGC